MRSVPQSMFILLRPIYTKHDFRIVSYCTTTSNAVRIDPYFGRTLLYHMMRHKKCFVNRPMYNKLLPYTLAGCDIKPISSNVCRRRLYHYVCRFTKGLSRQILYVPRYSELRKLFCIHVVSCTLARVHVLKNCVNHFIDRFYRFHRLFSSTVFIDCLHRLFSSFSLTVFIAFTFLSTAFGISSLRMKWPLLQ
jgi:hypothetical protein